MFGMGCNSSCPREDRPCLDWAHLDETYTIELVQHFGPEFFDDTAPPFVKVPLRPRTCGDSFDLMTGSVITMRGVSKVEPQAHDGECVSCYFVSAMPTLPVSSFSIRDRAWHNWGSLHFAAQGHAVVRDGCTGDYTIGIVPVWGFHVRTSDRRPPGETALTDHVLFREFAPDRGLSSACLVPGSQLVESVGVCVDSWAIRVRDSIGNLVTRDLVSLPPPTTASPDADAGRP